MPSSSTPPVPEEDIATRAEKVKEQGNAAFKLGKYLEAIDLYTKAIGMSSFRNSAFHILRFEPKSYYQLVLGIRRDLRREFEERNETPESRI